MAILEMIPSIPKKIIIQAEPYPYQTNFVEGSELLEKELEKEFKTENDILEKGVVLEELAGVLGVFDVIGNLVDQNLQLSLFD